LFFGSRSIGNRLTRENEALEHDLGATLELQRLDDDVVASLWQAFGATVDSRAHASRSFESGRAIGKQHREFDLGSVFVGDRPVQDQRVLFDSIEKTFGELS
jgi:hypothetical protein